MVTNSLEPDLKIGITLASFMRSGKTPFLNDRLKIFTSWGTIKVAAILSILIGMSDGPDDLLSSSKRRIVMTSVVLVVWKVKLVKILSRRKDKGDMGVFGILLSTPGPTLAKNY